MSDDKDLKTQHGKPLGRPYAPNKRDPGSKYKVRVVPTEPEVEVTKEEGTNRPIVTKPEKKED